MLFRVALGLFAMYKSEILKTTDVMEMMNLIRSLPKRVTSAHSIHYVDSRAWTLLIDSYQNSRRFCNTASSIR